MIMQLVAARLVGLAPHPHQVPTSLRLVGVASCPYPAPWVSPLLALRLLLVRAGVVSCPRQDPSLMQPLLPLAVRAGVVSCPRQDLSTIQQLLVVRAGVVSCPRQGLSMVSLLQHLLLTFLVGLRVLFMSVALLHRPGRHHHCLAARLRLHLLSFVARLGFRPVPLRLSTIET